MPRYRKYNGKDKYHFRFFRKNGRHPFIVVLVETKGESKKTRLSGYMITHDISKKLDYPDSYIQLNMNPNPKDDSPSYLCVTRIDNVLQKFFSKPFPNWHLSKEDEELIDELEKKKSS